MDDVPSECVAGAGEQECAAISIRLEGISGPGFSNRCESAYPLISAMLFDPAANAFCGWAFWPMFCCPGSLDNTCQWLRKRLRHPVRSSRYRRHTCRRRSIRRSQAHEQSSEGRLRAHQPYCGGLAFSCCCRAFILSIMSALMSSLVM